MVELFWSPGTNASPTATKSKTFQPSRKKFHGRGKYEAIRSSISTTKTARQSALSSTSVSPYSRSMPG